MLFKQEDLDEQGYVTPGAIEREARLMRVPFRVTPEFLHTLYEIAVQFPEEQSTEKMPPGRYIELQVGRHIENKFMFRFLF